MEFSSFAVSSFDLWFEVHCNKRACPYYSTSPEGMPAVSSNCSRLSVIVFLSPLKCFKQAANVVSY